MNKIANAIIFGLALAFALTGNAQTNPGGNVPYNPPPPGNKGTGSVTATSPVTSTGGTDPVIACATCGVTTSPLNQFATTTSAQLAAILSDETGTGAAVFANGGAINPASTGLTTPGTGAFSSASVTGNITAANFKPTGTVFGATGCGVASQTGGPSAGYFVAVSGDPLRHSYYPVQSTSRDSRMVLRCC